MGKDRYKIRKTISTSVILFLIMLMFAQAVVAGLYGGWACGKISDDGKSVQLMADEILPGPVEIINPEKVMEYKGKR